MMRIGTRMATVFDQHFAELGVTQAQFRMLLAVDDAGPEGVSPSTLADQLLLERATVTVITSRLVERELLERRPGSNRRTFRLVLTSEGAALLSRVVPTAIELADETLSGHRAEELRAMQAMLESIEARVRGYGTEG